MPRFELFRQLSALAAALKVGRWGWGMALLVACSLAAAQTPGEGHELDFSWYAVEVDVALVDHPLVEHAVVDAADTLAWESDELPRCHKPANQGGGTSWACECTDFGVPSRAAPMQINPAHAAHNTAFSLAQPQRIVQPPRPPPRMA
jgi:hypothetical protein